MHSVLSVVSVRVVSQCGTSQGCFSVWYQSGLFLSVVPVRVVSQCGTSQGCFTVWYQSGLFHSVVPVRVVSQCGTSHSCFTVWYQSGLFLSVVPVRVVSQCGTSQGCFTVWYKSDWYPESGLFQPLFNRFWQPCALRRLAAFRLYSAYFQCRVCFRSLQSCTLCSVCRLLQPCTVDAYMPSA
jgi:hypothetical protein